MITFEKSTRNVKLLVDGKHIKSFPLAIEHCLSSITDKHIALFNKSKVLKDKDIEIIKHLVFPILLQDFYSELKKSEPYVFELTVNNSVKGVRFVNSKYSGNRFELVLEKANLKISELLYTYGDKLPEIHSNY